MEYKDNVNFNLQGEKPSSLSLSLLNQSSIMVKSPQGLTVALRWSKSGMECGLVAGEVPGIAKVPLNNVPNP